LTLGEIITDDAVAAAGDSTTVQAAISRVAVSIVTRFTLVDLPVAARRRITHTSVCAFIDVAAVSVVAFFTLIDPSVATNSHHAVGGAGIAIGPVSIVAGFDTDLNKPITASWLGAVIQAGIGL
jgi:hypothetical protein